MTALFAAVRALHFASLMTAFGASALLLQARGIGVDGARFRRLLLVAAVIALLTALAWLCLVAGEMTGDPAAAIDGTTILLVVRQTFYGHVFLLRLVLLAGLCGFSLLKDAWLPRTLTAGAALALLGLTSHAAASGSPQYETLRAANDALHLIAAGFWLGGLVVLLPHVTPPRDLPRAVALLRLFSRWGVVSVAILLAAGTVNGIAILGAPGMRWSATYATWLAIKIVLAMLMVALALTNRFAVLPGLVRGDADARETIPLTVVAELSCAVLIVAIVGFLGVIAPMEM
ncbi:MAG: CopD family protein [Rhizomicrobium sp.]